MPLYYFTYSFLCASVWVFCVRLRRRYARARTPLSAFRSLPFSAHVPLCGYLPLGWRMCALCCHHMPAPLPRKAGPCVTAERMPEGQETEGRRGCHCCSTENSGSWLIFSSACAIGRSSATLSAPDRHMSSSSFRLNFPLQLFPFPPSLPALPHPTAYRSPLRPCLRCPSPPQLRG